jgi:hypothetical protein
MWVPGNPCDNDPTKKSMDITVAIHISSCQAKMSASLIKADNMGASWALSADGSDLSQVNFSEAQLRKPASEAIFGA